MGTRREEGYACSPALASLARIPPGQQAGVLQEARVPIISNDVCNGPDFYGNQIKPKMFCAGYREGGIDACQVRARVGQPRPCRSRDGGTRQWVVGLPTSGPEGSDHSLLPSERASSQASPSPARATAVVPLCVRTASLGRRVGGCVA